MSIHISACSSIPHIVNAITQQPPDWFTPNEVYWDDLCPQMRSVMFTCPLGPSAAAQGPKCRTPISIHRWPLNDAQSFEGHRRATCLLFKVTHWISRSHRQKINLVKFQHFWMITLFSIHRWLSIDPQSFEKHWPGVLLFIKVFCPVSMSHGPKYYVFGCSFVVSG